MNKKTIKKLLAVLMVPVLYYFVVSGFSTEASNESNLAINPAKVVPAPSTEKDFINCIFNGSFKSTPEEKWIDANITIYLGELNFNAIHIYDEINADTGTGPIVNGTLRYGLFDQELSQDQINNTKGLMDSIDNAGLKLVYERCKLSKLCYAQRLVYEVSQNSSTENYGFCYTDCSNYTTDSGRTVVHGYDPVQQYPDGYWLATDIYENLQHSDLYNFNPQFADSGTWYMKPMMRIDSSIVNNYPDKPVVRIVVNNFKGNTIRNVIIRAMNFKVGDSYNGQYTDEYTFNLVDSLKISGSVSDSNGLGFGYNGNLDSCKIDFKVYWMGQVEVWFDKMTVDDFYANKLFDPVPANNYDSYIEAEVTNFGEYDPLYAFFADECAHSNIPCIKYVVDKIRSIPKDAKISFATTNFFNTYGMREDGWGFEPILDVIQPDYFSVDAHEFWNWYDPPNYYGNYLPEDAFPDSVPQSLSERGLCASQFHVMSC